MNVSFIIPLYNCLELTQAMLRSLQATLPRELTYEIIFVDDGSTDGTRAWLSGLDHGNTIKSILNEKNLGYAGANNRGAEAATGDILVLLNNDLVLSDNWLKPMLDLLAADRGMGIVGNVQRSVATGAIDHSGIFINAKGKPAHDRVEHSGMRRMRIVPAVTGACLMISRELWQKLNGFDQAYLNGCEDVDLCLRARQLGALTAVALGSVIYHHVSASPGRKRNDEANTRRLFQKWRAQLAELGARDWCREYVARQLSAAIAFASPVSAAKIFAHAQGWTRRPPDVAIAGLQLAIDRELARWDQILGA